ncbi:hypothetical protein EV07_1475 [Prochlorococcus sp. MIT 0603]|nr:hypothetical protein EV07_1475 [Prochlorococcus sp. MIT 0603]
MIRSQFKVIKSFLLFLLISISCYLIPPKALEAKLELFENINGNEVQRSLESLRDLDDQTWQLVVYPQTGHEDNLVLRIVGFTGSLRLNHPEKLHLKSGLKSWDLKDITLSNPQLANDNRDAAAEFLLSPFLQELNNNRPLRLSLVGGFNDLPVPPYVVNEWRSMLKSFIRNET